MMATKRLSIETSRTPGDGDKSGFLERDFKDALQVLFLRDSTSYSRCRSWIFGKTAMVALVLLVAQDKIVLFFSISFCFKRRLP